MEKKPVSRTPPISAPASRFCPVWVAVLTSFSDGTNCKANKPFVPDLLWSRCFIAAIETPAWALVLVRRLWGAGCRWWAEVCSHMTSGKSVICLSQFLKVPSAAKRDGCVLSSSSFSAINLQIFANVYWTTWLIKAQSAHGKPMRSLLLRSSQCEWGDLLWRYHSPRGVRRKMSFSQCHWRTRSCLVTTCFREPYRIGKM